MADCQKRSLTDVGSVEEERPSAKRRKPRNGVTQLAEMRPGTAYQLVAQYGSTDDPTFVMQLTLDGNVFKGIGPSKTKAKVMAAEFALMHLGVISSLTEPPPDLSNQLYCWDDFTADIFDSNSSIYFDFNHQAANAENHDGGEIHPIQIEENTEFESSSESTMIGKNTLTILMDRHPGSSYKLVAAQVDSVRTKFVMDCFVNGRVFRGAGMSKRLAKARAAKQALQTLDNMEFGTGEDGMPFYEGDEKIWLKYKAELEKEAELKLQHEVGDNHVQQLSEYFPDVKFSFPDTFEKPDITDFYICSILVEGSTYEGSGTSKRDAKNDAAASALNDLETKGILKQKELEMENKKQEREEKKKSKDGTDRKPTVYKSAVAKLNDNFQNMEYKFLSETPLKNTRITAFTVAVSVKGKNYIGVGKNKRMAKLDAAEKVLKDLGMWTEQDDLAKERLKTEEDDLDIVENNIRGWNSGQDQQCWGPGWGQEMSWNSGANPYVGYDNNCNNSWGYGGFYYGMGGEGAWGHMGANQGVNFETFQPMMKEIMGSMFETTFGSNPWKADSGSGVDVAGAGGTGHGQQGSQSKGRFSSRWDSNVNLGNKSDVSFYGSTENSATCTSTASSSTMSNNPSEVNTRSNFNQASHSKENSGDSEKLSKYPNFRSAGYNTGFAPSFANQSTSSSGVQNQPLPSSYGPYGSPINSSVAGGHNANFQSSDYMKTGSYGTRNQTKDSFQGSGIYTSGASGSVQNSLISSGTYSYGLTDGMNRGNSSGFGTGTYSDFGKGKYQGHPVTSGADGFQSGNSMNFTSGGGTTSGYAAGNYPSGDISFQSSGTNYNYSSGGNSGDQTTTVPTTVYKSNQVNYSTNLQTGGSGSSPGGMGFSSGSYQSGSSYTPDADNGYYRMFNSGYQQQNQGYEFGYDTLGNYNMNTGYNMGNYQNSNTDSGYAYEYSASNTGTNSYYTNMNRTHW